MMIDTKWKASVEKGPRSLNANEIRVIESFAENVSEEEKRQILFDLARLSVRSVTDDGELLEFDIEGYERPPYWLGEPEAHPRRGADHVADEVAEATRMHRFVRRGRQGQSH